MSTADEWFTEFITNLENSKPRRRRLWRERRGIVPVKDELARMYEQETEMKRRVIAHERTRFNNERKATA